jgi:glucose-1-phosphate adenylyltransferase
LEKTLAIVMAGGVGERLRPLTRDRAKPAVPFGGKYRLIDFTLSNCINSKIRHVFVLTQYKSASLNMHLQEGWGISSSGLGEYVYTMPAQQKLGSDWYGGTADAVRQNLDLIRGKDIRRILVLSGDHVYKMDYSQMLNYHLRKGSSLTVSTVSVPKGEAAGRLGVLEADSSGRVLGFEEKPLWPKERVDAPGYALVSMGVYIFSVEALLEALTGGEKDFGKEVIPAMINKGREIHIYPYESENRVADCAVQTKGNTVKKVVVKRGEDSSYWRDVGTIDTYFQASMDLLGERPLFNLYSENWPIRTHQQPLPPSKCVLGGSTCGSIVSDGCIIKAASVESSVLSPEVMVERDARVEHSVIFDRVRIGPGARIRRAIIDKEVTVQPGASLGYDPEADEKRGCTVSETGIVVVSKGAVIESI